MICSMELMGKVAAAAITVSVLGLLLRRYDPELVLLLGAVTAAGALAAALGLLDGLRDLRTLLRSFLGDDAETLMSPVIKCLGVTLLSKFAADLCRDASQSALACAVELTGNLFCVALTLPLLMSVLKIMGGWA